MGKITGGTPMPYAQSEGARIYYEETGAGTPILFIHEFGGDHRSWDDQMRHFARGWRCITFGSRGYPPSDCPQDEKLYGQDLFNRDAIAVLDAAGRVLSCTAAGAGSGALKSTRAQFIEETRQRAARFERAGRIDAEAVGLNPTRVQLQNKDLMGWRTFVAHLAEHPAHAAAKTLRNVQAGRASLYDMEAE